MSWRGQIVQAVEAAVLGPEHCMGTNLDEAKRKRQGAAPVDFESDRRILDLEHHSTLRRDVFRGDRAPPCCMDLQ